MLDTYRTWTDDPGPLVIKPEPWIADAACKEVDPEIFFPELEGGRWAVHYARKVCAKCPVSAACAEYAIRTNQKEGIWAGLTPKQIRLRREAGSPA